MFLLKDASEAVEKMKMGYSTKENFIASVMNLADSYCCLSCSTQSRFRQFCYGSCRWKKDKYG